jgi:ABC-type branched-subunit amino acid transport system substrate-binding protein
VRCRTALVAALLLLVPACQRGDARAPQDQALLVVSAPIVLSPADASWVANFASRGALLAADEINAQGGIDTGAGRRRIRIDVMDNAGEPAKAAEIAREAVAHGATALITDGTGAEEVARITGAARLPTFVMFDGRDGIVGPDKPTMFRMAPAIQPMVTRLADYLAAKRPTVAIVSDDSPYGRSGKVALEPALQRADVPVAATVDVPALAKDVARAVGRARASGATALVVWADSMVVALTVKAAREADWDVRIYTGPTGGDPLVRNRLFRHPEWVDGLTFMSFRATSEAGPAPFERFRASYEKRFPRESTAKDSGGTIVDVPPDWQILSYDTVQLVEAALRRSGGARGEPLLTALEQVSVTSANGGPRGFSAGSHEGVPPGDLYFAVIDDMRYAPVKDDPLSAGLPVLPQ